jgi:hypothetical protein
MKSISLTQGKQTIVDDIDFEYLSKWRWFLNRYAGRMTTIDEGGGKRIRIGLHQVVVERALGACPVGYIVDHKNRNVLDNRRSNLRYATKSVNALNTKKKGYSRRKDGRWQVVVNGKYLYFRTEQEAIKVRENRLRLLT